MGKPYEVPGEGTVEFPDSMSDADIQAVIRRKYAATRQQASASRQGNYDYTPPHDPVADPEGATAHMFGRTSAPVGTPREIAEDVLTRVADSASFGTLPKLSAKIGEWQGKGTYDEILARRRQEVDNAGNRLGTPTTILADVGGGAGIGGVMARAGITALGRLPATAPLAQKILAGGVEGFGYGAAHGAGHTDTGKLEDYAKNAWESGKVGAATGAAIPAIAGATRLVTPLPAAGNPARDQMVKTLDDIGVDVGAGVRTNSPRFHLLEDVVGKLPFGRRPPAQQMEKVTAEAAKRAGIGGGPITPETLADGFQRIGGGIGAINKSAGTIHVDDDLLNGAVKAEADLPLVSGGYQKSVRHFIDKITGSAELTPELAQSIRTQLGMAIRGQNGSAGDKAYQSVLIDLRESLDGALTRTLRAAGKHDEVAELLRLRQQYANLHVLTDALASSGAAGEAGVLTPTALTAAQKRSLGKGGYMTGQGDLTDIARASHGLLQPPKDSYTATREGMLNPAKIAAGAVLGPLVNSRPAQAYWGNQILPAVPPSLLQRGIAGAVAGPDEELVPPGLLSP